MTFTRACVAASLLAACPAFFVVATMAGAADDAKPVKILVAYFSANGHTENMARHVASGARSVKGVEVTLAKVDDIANSDVLAADAIILGSPVYNANVHPKVQTFINAWPFRGKPLLDKLGAAFVTGGGISAGEELTQLNLLHSMLVFGMIVVGGDDWRSPFGASGVVAEKPFGEEDARGFVDARFLSKGDALGRRVARLAARMRGE